jgi:hypothetical protein
MVGDFQVSEEGVMGGRFDYLIPSLEKAGWHKQVTTPNLWMFGHPYKEGDRTLGVVSYLYLYFNHAVLYERHDRGRPRLYASPGQLLKRLEWFKLI